MQLKAHLHTSVICDTGSSFCFVIHGRNSSVPPAHLSADLQWQLPGRCLQGSLCTCSSSPSMVRNLSLFHSVHQFPREPATMAIYYTQSMSVPCFLEGYRGAAKINQDVVPALKLQPSRNLQYINT